MSSEQRYQVRLLQFEFHHTSNSIDDSPLFCNSLAEMFLSDKEHSAVIVNLFSQRVCDLSDNAKTAHAKGNRRCRRRMQGFSMM